MGTKKNKIYYYKVCHKFLKIRPKFNDKYYCEMIDYGFLPFVSDENSIDNEVVYAIPIVLDRNSYIIVSQIKTLKKMVGDGNSKLSIEDRIEAETFLEKFKSGDEKTIKDTCKAQLVFSSNAGIPGALFINSGGVEYYNDNLIDNACGGIVKVLLNVGAIYKKRLRE